MDSGGHLYVARLVENHENVNNLAFRDDSMFYKDSSVM